MQTCRRVFDWATGYSSEMNERKWLARMLYLETVAGVPGMVAGMMRHMRSLRTMKRDRWGHGCACRQAAAAQQLAPAALALPACIWVVSVLRGRRIRSFRLCLVRA